MFSLFQIVAKEREVSEWKEKYEESRREVMEMRWVINLITLSESLSLCVVHRVPCSYNCFAQLNLLHYF